MKAPLEQARNYLPLVVTEANELLKNFFSTSSLS